MERWAEYYQNLYSKENVVAENALNSIPNLPVTEELDAPPTEEELRKAIDSLAHGKAPGGNGILAEVLQRAKPTLTLAPPPHTPLSMLGRRISATIHARRKHRDSLQK
jgi:hypothetical protein